MRFRSAVMYGVPLLMAVSALADEAAPPVRTTEKLTQGPQLISKPPLFYPPIARQANDTGPVQVEIVIGKDGQGHSAHAVAGPNLLRHFAEAAVKQWRFRPAMIEKTPVEASFSVTLDYHLKP